MANLTIVNTPIPAFFEATPAVYENEFFITTAAVTNSKIPVSLYFFEISNAEIICACPIPYLEFTEIVYSVLEFGTTVSQYLSIEASAASGDCEDC
jgi:hypothetical protein